MFIALGVLWSLTATGTLYEELNSIFDHLVEPEEIQEVEPWIDCCTEICEPYHQLTVKSHIYFNSAWNQEPCYQIELVDDTTEEERNEQ